MTSADIQDFLKAFENVKNDYTCRVCSELCKNPVTLSKCFHMICAEHFDSLKACPNCGIDLEGCNTFTDDRLSVCIDSTKEINNMLKRFKPSEISSKKVKKYDGTVLSTHSAQDTIRPEKSRPPLLDISTTSSRFSKTNEKRNNKGETPLHVACRLGKVEKITELLNQGANTNTKDNAGWTPLHEVVQNGRLDLVKLLLQYNTLINVPGQSNETPLHEAVRYKHIDIARELVTHGADPNMPNIKGETPLQLATDEMRKAIMDAAEDIVQTQSVNIMHMSNLHLELESEDIRIYCVSQYKTAHNKLKTLSRHHDNIHIEVKFTKKVTHLIVDTEDGICAPSIDVLQGIVSSLWIISSEWVTNSTDDKLEPFDKYEVIGVGTKTYTGPKTARFNKYKQLPGLFDGCHFYFHNFNTKYEISKSIVVTKALLSKLVTDAGGIVLRRVPNPESIPEQEKLVPYHAKRDGKLAICSHYIIFKDMYEPMYNMRHLKALPIGWLIECIEKYELCEPW
ncbi:hypothetical protein O3G_MSEX012158 [Manduca sexta]|uniref:BRCT domain-containing protein n=1 Tax=Manduca sexta TaxID=7130 RepID=A0A921ZPJ3_MANSE|nr:hypothetical protein O3G_MSEX012158 [Manduca sexta]